MDNILITGASGFVGQNLQDYLKRTYRTYSLSIRYIPNQKFDLKGDVVIHLAGKAHNLKKVKNPSDYYEANFELTKQLFDSFLNSEASIFIFISTVKSVADVVEGVLKEDETPNPITIYGKSKLAAEIYILSKKIPNGKRVYILRPCMIHGPNNKGNLNLLYSFVSKGIPYPFGKYENKRSFVSIENLCFIINELIDNPKVESGIYNVADDEPLSSNELIRLIAEAQNRQARIVNIPKYFVNKIAKLGDVLHLPLNSERLQKLTDNYVVINDKIVTALGKDLPINAKKGLLKTFNSFKNK